MNNPLQQFLASLDKPGRRQYFKEFERQRRSWPPQMTPLPLPADLPPDQQQIKAQWRSRWHLAIHWKRDGHEYLNMHRVEMDQTGMWLPGITWEDMQAIKQQCGFGLMVGHVLFPSNYDPVPQNIYTMWLHDPIVPPPPKPPAA
jgi:hypothetical protein